MRFVTKGLGGWGVHPGSLFFFFYPALHMKGDCSIKVPKMVSVTISRCVMFFCIFVLFHMEESTDVYTLGGNGEEKKHRNLNSLKIGTKNCQRSSDR